MAAHASVYHSISPPYRLSFFLSSTVRAFSPLPPPCFSSTVYTGCRSPSVALFNIWVPLSRPSQCFGSFACPKIVLAPLWHTDPSSSLNGPVWYSRGLWKECLITELVRNGAPEGWWKSMIGWCFKMKVQRKFFFNCSIIRAIKPIGWDEKHVIFPFI